MGATAVGGAVVGSDRRTTGDGTVTGDSLRRLVVVDGAAAVAAGDPGSVEAFLGRVERAVREHRTREGEPPGVGRLARVAADEAEAAGVEAVVVARDDGGAAALRAATADGGVLADRVVAFGTGAPVALGRLEGLPEDADLDAAEAAVREALERAADRDSETGETVDVWRLADADADSEDDVEGDGGGGDAES